MNASNPIEEYHPVAKAPRKFPPETATAQDERPQNIAALLASWEPLETALPEISSPLAEPEDIF